MSALFSFGAWLKQRRSALLLSRQDLARQVGVAEISIRKIEADERRPSHQVAALLATALQLAPEANAIFVQVARGLLAVDQLPPPIPGTTVPPTSARATPAPVPPLLPNGTVTFLFTDIVGSTQLWEQHPQAMLAALARHDAILVVAIAAHQGTIVKHRGDGVLASFGSAPDGLAAALQAQRTLHAELWGGTGPLRVRMALHTGVAEIRGGDYFGPPLNRAARLLDTGHGGQILLSHATEQLVRDQLPPEVQLRDLGAQLLKGLSRPEEIFQLVAPDLPADFPPLQMLRGDPWALERSTRLLDQIAAALTFAHRHNIIHRDLRPATILLDEDGNAYLADFGIVEDLHTPNVADPTEPGAIIRSPTYLAPEQITDGPITAQTDIYSLGRLLYEILTGVHPFGDLPPAERLVQQLHGPLPSLRVRRPDLPLMVDAIIQQATAIHPADPSPDVLSMALDWHQALVTLLNSE